jgi:hypothetical protein
MSVRTIHHRDGRQEIVRVLSTSDLTNWKKDQPLSYEKSIMWLENIERLPFVRVLDVRCATSRRGRLLIEGGGRVIGYSKLMADAPRDPNTRQYSRRLFFLRQDDPTDEVPATSGPIVDPRTVLPGVAGSPPARRKAV